jgi:hypothetical protein
LAIVALLGYFVYWFAAHRPAFLPPPGQEHPSPWLAVAGLVAGVAGLAVAAGLLPALGINLALAALVLGVLATRSVRPRLALTALVFGAVGLALTLGYSYLGVLQAVPTQAVREQLLADDTAAFVSSHPEAEIVQATVEFWKKGGVPSKDQAMGVSAVQCYITHIAFIAADGTCRVDVRPGWLALVDGEWSYDWYEQVNLEMWDWYGCGDRPMLSAPVECPTPPGILTP